MKKWDITPGINPTDSTLRGEVYYDKGAAADWRVTQDIAPFLKQVQREREDLANNVAARKNHYRKFATIPDVVSIEILENHGLDIHHPEFMKTPEEVQKLKRIVMSEYPYLIVST
jgi:hypothetical protein